MSIKVGDSATVIGEVSVLEVNVSEDKNGIELEFVRGISRQYIVLNVEELETLFRVIQKLLNEN